MLTHIFALEIFAQREWSKFVVFWLRVVVFPLRSSVGVYSRNDVRRAHTDLNTHHRSHDSLRASPARPVCLCLFCVFFFGLFVFFVFCSGFVLCFLLWMFCPSFFSSSFWSFSFLLFVLFFHKTKKNYCFDFCSKDGLLFFTTFVTFTSCGALQKNILWTTTKKLKSIIRHQKSGIRLFFRPREVPHAPFATSGMCTCI